ncbi:MAG: O-antigen ligase family protein, partial [Chloroflexota bacterium]
MTSSKLCALCNGIIDAGWLAAVVVTPLYFNGYSSTVVEPDKLAVLRTIVSIMAAAWLVQWIEQRRKPSPQPAVSLRAPFVLPMLLLVAVHLLATFTSIVPRISFFGAYSRPQGVDAILTYVVLFALVLSGLRTRRQLNRLIEAIILTSFPVALYGIIQQLGLDPQQWSDYFGDRITSTLGNPIFLAAYLIILFPITFAKIVENLRALVQARRAMAPQVAGVVVYAAIACVQSAAIVLAQSRGPWLGWFAGFFLFVVLLALAFRYQRFVIGVFGLGFAGIVFLVILNLPGAALQPLRALPMLDRLGRLANPTGEFRLLTWSNAARLVMPHAPVQFPDGAPERLNVIRPLVGYGPDTMALVYPQVSSPDPFSLNTVTDRSHNGTWDALVITGMLGLLAYQFLFLSIFFYGLRGLGLLETQRACKTFIALWFGLGLAGGLSAILVGQPGLLGVGMPAGNIAAVLIV